MAAMGIKMQKVKQLALSSIIPILIIIGWYYITNYTDTPKAILPKISAVGAAFIKQAKNGQLAADVSVSVKRVLEGYFFASLLGVTMGALMGMSRTIRNIFMLTLNTIRQIPMMAWIPMIILWCGIEDLSKIVVIVLGAFFPIMVNTLSGITSTPQGYIEVAKLYRLSNWKIFTKVYLPSALPQIFVGLKLGLGISWMAVVAAELIASSKGIGYRISDARNLMKPDIMIVGMLLIGIIGILMDRILSFIAAKVTPWVETRRA
jgi:sulfonate transport system permease protein